MSKQIPPKLSLRSLQNQAKQLLTAYQSGSPPAIERLRTGMARLADVSDAEILSESLTLRDMQHVIAREYGADHWASLKQLVPVLAEGKTKIVRSNPADPRPPSSLISRTTSRPETACSTMSSKARRPSTGLSAVTASSS